MCFLGWYWRTLLVEGILVQLTYKRILMGGGSGGIEYYKSSYKVIRIWNILLSAAPLVDILIL